MTLGINQLTTVETLQKVVKYIDDKIVMTNGVPYYEWEYDSGDSGKELCDWLGNLEARTAFVHLITPTATGIRIDEDGENHDVKALFYYASRTIEDKDDYRPACYMLIGKAYIKYYEWHEESQTWWDWYELKDCRLPVNRDNPNSIMLEILEEDELESGDVRWNDPIEKIELMKTLPYAHLAMDVTGMHMKLKTGSYTANPRQAVVIDYTLSGELTYDRDSECFTGSVQAFNESVVETFVIKAIYNPVTNAYEAYSARSTNSSTVAISWRDCIGDDRYYVDRASDGTWSFYDRYMIGKYDSASAMLRMDKETTVIHGNIGRADNVMLTCLGTTTEVDGERTVGTFTDGVDTLYIYDDDEVILETNKEEQNAHYYIRTFEIPSSYPNYIWRGLTTEESFDTTWSGNLNAIDSLIIKDKAEYIRFWKDVEAGNAVIDLRSDVKGSGSGVTTAYHRMNVDIAKLSFSGKEHHVLEMTSKTLQRGDDGRELTEKAPIITMVSIDSYRYRTSSVEWSDYPAFWNTNTSQPSVDCSFYMKEYVAEDEDSIIPYSVSITIGTNGYVKGVSVFDNKTDPEHYSPLENDSASYVMKTYTGAINVSVRKESTSGGSMLFSNKVIQHVDKYVIDNGYTETVNTWQMVHSHSCGSQISSMKEEAVFGYLRIVTGKDKWDEDNIILFSNRYGYTEYTTFEFYTLEDASDVNIVLEAGEPVSVWRGEAPSEFEKGYNSRQVEVPIFAIYIQKKDYTMRALDFSGVDMADYICTLIRRGANVKLIRYDGTRWQNPYRFIDVDLGSAYASQGNEEDSGDGAIYFSNGSHLKLREYGGVPYLVLMPNYPIFRYDRAEEWRLEGNNTNKFKYNSKTDTREGLGTRRLAVELASFITPRLEVTRRSDIRNIQYRLKTGNIICKDTSVPEGEVGKGGMLGSVICDCVDSGYNIVYVGDAISHYDGYAVFSGVTTATTGSDVDAVTSFRTYSFNMTVKYRYVEVDPAEGEDYDFVMSDQQLQEGFSRRYCRLTKWSIQAEADLLADWN